MLQDFPSVSFSPLYMQSMSHHSILLSLRKRTHKSLWDNLEFTADADRVKLVYFDITRRIEVQKLLTWISNILVLILPHCYRGPPRLCKTLFYEIME